MGTNFYAGTETNKFQHHIGKRSGGWIFSFQAQPSLDVYSSKQWETFLKENQEYRVYSEYELELSPSEFFRTIVYPSLAEANSQYYHEKKDAQERYKAMLAEFGQPAPSLERLEGITPGNTWLDAYGFSVSLSDFS